MVRRPLTAALVLVLVASVTAGCSADPDPQPQPRPTAPSPTGSPSASAEPQRPLAPGEVTEAATGLRAPWSVVPVRPHEQGDGGDRDGWALISERDTAAIIERTPDGDLRQVRTVPGVAPAGEGGLLGLATNPDDPAWLYAYFTADRDNRIVRMALAGEPGAITLGDPEVILDGIPKARTHNGGRIAFGPDGMLYATTGDAGNAGASQDPDSLAGKILRMTPDGAAPDDSPFGSVVHSIGHRNPQGLVWGDDGTLYSSEFGQNTWDELNIIVPGGNYGWPTVEGIADTDGFINPIAQWSTAEASPSGIASVDGTLFMAALRGARLWTIWVDPENVDTQAFFTGDYGRMRDAAPGPDGTLWVLTNNTDGRGTPNPGDDKLLQIQLSPRDAG